jgi:hypothetical protein
VVEKVSDYIDSAICFDGDGNDDLYKNLIEGLKFSVISLPNASIDQVRDHYNTIVKPKRQSLGEGQIVVQSDDEPEHMRDLSSNFVVVIDQASLDSINSGPDAVFKLRRGAHWLTATEGELKTFIRLVDVNYDEKPRQLGAASRGGDPSNTRGAHFWEGWMTITPRSLIYVARWDPDFEHLFLRVESKEQVYDMYETV